MTHVKVMWKIFLLLLLVPAMSYAQQVGALPKMPLVGIFDAGQPGAVIMKLQDEKDGILCYVLMPENVARQQINGVWTFAGNNIGSISCVPSNKKQASPELKR
jgi:hypothetical protein